MEQTEIRETRASVIKNITKGYTISQVGFTFGIRTAELE